ncbi:MAG: SRPBCC domain-containing protein [Bacteroidota bacterium]|nr:SRPBCC domain-containing protein [Bacteroidota bacterium]
MNKSINHKIFFPHSPETVWEYLTNSELMELWLMKNTFQPILGSEFQFRTNPIPGLDFDGIFYCKVLEIQPFQKLSYSWRSGPGGEEITLDSIVVWQLEKVEKGTQLLLEHTGFAKEENINFYNGLNQGWVEKLDNIAKLINIPQHGDTNT